VNSCKAIFKFKNITGISNCHAAIIFSTGKTSVESFESIGLTRFVPKSKMFGQKKISIRSTIIG